LEEAPAASSASGPLALVVKELDALALISEGLPGAWIDEVRIAAVLALVLTRQNATGREGTLAEGPGSAIVKRQGSGAGLGEGRGDAVRCRPCGVGIVEETTGRAAAGKSGRWMRVTPAGVTAACGTMKR